MWLSNLFIKMQQNAFYLNYFRMSEQQAWFSKALTLLYLNIILKLRISSWVFHDLSDFVTRSEISLQRALSDHSALTTGHLSSIGIL